MGTTLFVQFYLLREKQIFRLGIYENIQKLGINYTDIRNTSLQKNKHFISAG